MLKSIKLSTIIFKKLLKICRIKLNIKYQKAMNLLNVFDTFVKRKVFFLH